jgi:hypothetical protein
VSLRRTTIKNQPGNRHTQTGEKMSYKINVYANEPLDCGGFQDNQIVARVNYNQRLDYWNGNNMQNGGMGRHKGITKLRKPVDPKKPYVIIIGSQWQGSTDYGYLVTAQEAAQEVMQSGDQESDWLWPEIAEIIKKLEAEEE